MSDEDKKIDIIINKFKNKDIIVINLSLEIIKSNFMLSFEDDKEENFIIYNFQPIRQKVTISLNEDDINFLCSEITKEIKLFKGRIILIIFNEYFFSNFALKESQRNSILDSLYLLTAKNNNDIFFLLNFLYELKNAPSNEEIAVLKDYLEPIRTRISVFNFEPSNEQLIHNEKNSKWFTNESILFYNNNIIFSQKKQYFKDEIILFNNNFILGFGDKRTELKKNSSYYKLYDYFNKCVNLDICMDIQMKYGYNRKNFMDYNISYLHDTIQNNINKKRKIFQQYNNGENYSQKDYYIIQSNTTNLNYIMEVFPERKIVIQSDPKNSGIFVTNYSESFKDMLNEFNTNKKRFFIQLKEKKDLHIIQNFKDKDLQENEYNRAWINAEEYFSRIVNGFFQPNFYNLISRIKPIRYSRKPKGNLRFIFQIYDFKTMEKKDK